MKSAKLFLPLIWCSLAFIFMLCGCSKTSTLEKGSVNENIFVYPDDPLIKVNIDPELTYVGCATRTKLPDEHGLDSSLQEFEAYIFIKADQQKNIQKLAYIEIARIKNGAWLDKFGNSYTVYHYNKVLNGNSYSGSVNIFCNDFDFYVDKFLNDKDYNTSTCKLYNVLSRVLPLPSNARIELAYGQPVAETDLEKFFGPDFNNLHSDKIVISLTKEAMQNMAIISE